MDANTNFLALFKKRAINIALPIKRLNTSSSELILKLNATACPAS
jgi:hypothetical protein